MPHTHKKTIKNQKQEKGSSLKIKQQRRRRMMGGSPLIPPVIANESLVPKHLTNSGLGFENEPQQVPKYLTNSGLGFENEPQQVPKYLTNSGLGFENEQVSSPLEPEKEVSDIVTEVVIPTNTSFVKSNLNYNPFYSKKSSDVVENKKIYNFDTNYILEEIEKLKSKDRNFMITSDIISQILESKPKTHDEISVDHKRQQELHRDLCDFD
jgi:hypothetical protein